jgi:hypothetical protein
VKKKKGSPLREPNGSEFLQISIKPAWAGAERQTSTVALQNNRELIFHPPERSKTSNTLFRFILPENRLRGAGIVLRRATWKYWIAQEAAARGENRSMRGFEINCWAGGAACPRLDLAKKKA